MGLSQSETSGPAAGRAAGFGLLVIGIVAGALFYWNGIESLLTAWERPEYSHGYLIPLIAVFLFLKRVNRQPTTPKKQWIGVVVVAAALIVGLLGRLAAVSDVVTYGLVLATGGLVLAVRGIDDFRKLWPAWFYLVFMLPLPNFIYWPLSIKLQFLSSQIGVALISLMNIPVFLDGNIIDLGVYQLQVAEACSGLRYLFPLASFGFLFAALYRGPTWHKVLLFVSAAPITVLMNSVRIALIGFLVNAYGIKQAEGFLHFFEGWVIFAVCILMMFGLATLLHKLTNGDGSLPLDVSTGGLWDELKTFGNIQPSRALATATVFFCLAALSGTALGHRQMVYPDRQRFANFPMEVGDWRGASDYLDFQIERVLAADDYIMAAYQTSDNSQKQSVGLLIAYYRALNEGSGVHSPEVCIPAGGWEVSRWSQTSVQVDGAAQSLRVNRAIIQKGLDRQLVYYWYQHRENQITNDYVFKAYTVVDSILNRRADGALMRVITPIEGNDVSAAEQRLRQFLAVSMPLLPDYVPR